jgi:hypothetical protein
MVVLEPWPGRTIVSSASVSTFVRSVSVIIRMSPPGRSVRPIEPANSVSPANITPLPSSISLRNTTEPWV